MFIEEYYDADEIFREDIADFDAPEDNDPDCELDFENPKTGDIDVLIYDLTKDD